MGKQHLIWPCREPEIICSVIYLFGKPRKQKSAWKVLIPAWIGLRNARPSVYMGSKLTEQTTASTTHIPTLPMLSKAQRRIAKLEERQQKLDAARAKAIKELADEERNETIASGQAEFLTALVALDPTTREMVVSNVLQATEDSLRRDKIQAWAAMIPKSEPRKNGIETDAATQRDDTSSTNKEDTIKGADSDSARHRVEWRVHHRARTGIFVVVDAPHVHRGHQV